MIASAAPSSAVAVLAAGIAVAACGSRLPETVASVHDIRISGNRALSADQIKKRILTSETGWWPFARRQPFDLADWQTDLRRIARLYEAQGYYNARVVRSQVKPYRKGEVDLEVEIEEGEPVEVAEVALRGIDSLAAGEQTAVQTGLPLHEGSIFKEAAWDEARQLVARRLRDLGHATSRLEGYAVVDVVTHRAQLQLDVWPGPRYRFGDVEVRTQPDAAASPHWIAEKVRLAIGSHRLFSESALEEAQRRVFAMQVFSAARVTVGEPNPATGLIPVVAEVREGPMRTLRLGGGFGVDQIRQEVRLTADWTNRNFLGGLRRLDARALGGWAFIPSALAVLRADALAGARSGPIYRAGLDFQQPRLLGRPSLSGKSTIESERTIEETFDSIGGRFIGGVSWEPHSTLTVFPSYNLQTSWITGPHVTTARSAPLAIGCQTDPCFVVLSYLEQVVTWDTRDSALEPRRGRYLALSFQQGGGPLGGNFDYLRVLPEARGYVTVGDGGRVTLAARLRLGLLATLSGRSEDSAVSTRFYSGGANWMRGFATRRLSPLLLVPLSGAAGGGQRLALPVGGSGLVEGSLEARLRFTDNLLVAAFTDFGSVTHDRLPLGGIPRMLWAVGLGVRYLTPVGPLRLDVAFRLPFGRPPPLFDLDGAEITYERTAGNGVVRGSESGRFVNDSCFGIGGSHRSSWVSDGLCAFHISIGEAF